MSWWSGRLMRSLDQQATVLDTDHGSIQVARAGDGPPVMVVHGGPGGFDQGLAFGRHLRDGGCELIAPSRPGYLRTPLISGRRPAEQADLYAAMLDVLRIGKVTVLGVSSGGPSAVHFAARHPQRTTALLLDCAVLLAFDEHLNPFERMLSETGFGVWLSYQLAGRWPAMMTAVVVDAFSEGLNKGQRREAITWITSDPARQQSIKDLLSSAAPRKHRQPGQGNDESIEPDLDPLPFADVTAPTLVAHGTNDGLVPSAHATHAADQIAGAELILVEEGHHALPLCRHYEPVAHRQLELSRG